MRYRTNRGFTLIELLVVLVILGLLAGLVGPRVIKHLGDSKTKTAILQIEELSGALDVYRLEVGRYPSSDQGLMALIEKPADAEVIASTDFCTNAGLAYKGKAMSFQPHPEFSPDYMRDLIRYKIEKGTMPVEQAEAALEAVGDENDSGEIAAQLASFFLAAKAEKAA